MNNKFISSDKTNEVILTINPAMEEAFMEIFEIQMLQGERTVTDDGQIKFVMTFDPEEIPIIKDAFINAIFKTDSIELN